jgi:hypothetical protein
MHGRVQTHKAWALRKRQQERKISMSRLGMLDSTLEDDTTRDDDNMMETNADTKHESGDNTGSAMMSPAEDEVVVTRTFAWQEKELSVR